MLFLARKLPLPKSCAGHPQWRIAVALRDGSQARKAMRQWLLIVKRASEELNVTGRLESAIRNMVQMTAENRIQVDVL
jgi:hypothetical protein